MKMKYGDKEWATLKVRRKNVIYLRKLLIKPLYANTLNVNTLNTNTNANINILNVRRTDIIKEEAYEAFV